MNDQHSEPAYHFAVPGYQQLLAIRHWATDDLKIKVEYLGTPEELIASGIATAEMLVVNKPKGPRIKRLDQAGFRFRLSRRWRYTDSNGALCQPYQWFSIIRERPTARIGELPWAQEAVAAAARHEAWRASVGRPYHEELSPGLGSESWPDSPTRH